jgi:hypothetical protein
VKLRPGVATDAAALAELGARTFSDTFLADNDPDDIAAFMGSDPQTDLLFRRSL